MSFFDRIKQRFQQQKPPTVVSQDEAVALINSMNQPTATPQPRLYRNPMIDTYRRQRPESFDQIASAVQIASQETGVPPDLLFDLAGVESGINVAAKNPHSTARGAFQYINSTAQQMGIDPLNATESARATAKALKRRKLHWWEAYNKPGADKKKLTDFYSEAELAPYLQ